MLFSNSKNKRLFITFISVIFSSFLQTYTIQTFMRPSNLLPSGFTGLAILLNTVSNGIISTSFGILLLNLPTAFLCYKKISFRFTLFSCLQFFMTSLFLSVFTFPVLFNDIVLNLAFGGFFYGMSVVIALKADASTGGTDFIALYFSNKFNRSLWQYVFIFNCIVLTIFGFTQGWLYAAYSMLFQFISYKTIETFHTRYNRLTLQITTEHPQAVLEVYTKYYHHGVSCMEGYGGYSRKPFTILNTVVSSYEIKEIIRHIKEVDPYVIINIFKTEDFVGGFYQKPFD